ncbi:MAG: OmpA family protein [Flavobacteriales bacterium]|nr:OmpA family protein [Flavobacteriales bacterium]
MLVNRVTCIKERGENSSRSKAMNDLFKRVITLGVLAILLLGKIDVQAQKMKRINLLSLRNGGHIEFNPSSQMQMSKYKLGITEYSGLALIDGNRNSGWMSLNTQFPLVFVFELSEESILSKFVIITPDGKTSESPKDIRIGVKSPGSENYTLVVSTVIDKYRNWMAFEIDPVSARSVKVVVLSNYGGEVTEFLEIEAWGTYVNENSEPINITGDWDGLWGLASVKQIGDTVMGCFKHDGISFSGTMNRKVLTAIWNSPNGSGMLVHHFTENVNRSFGTWWEGDNPNVFGIVEDVKVTDLPSECLVKKYVPKPVEKKVLAVVKPPSPSAPKKVEYVKPKPPPPKKHSTYVKPVGSNLTDKLEKALLEDGKFVSSQIKFKPSSHFILEESYPVLFALAQILKAHPEMRVRVTGHTDNIGDTDYHQNLSYKRSVRIQTFLFNRKQISKNRIVCVGMGDKMPIYSNDTEEGRAMNRRIEVEVVKK